MGCWVSKQGKKVVASSTHTSDRSNSTCIGGKYKETNNKTIFEKYGTFKVTAQ